jgi:inner membrane protein
LLRSQAVFIAHVPAGYLLTRRLEARWRTSGLLPVGLAASVLPDLDLLWFDVVDHRRVLHHHYWTHVPFWWGVIAATWCVGYAGMRRRSPGVGSAVFFGNVFLHLFLDTIVGGVAWLAPFSRHLYSLVTVPAGHRWWIWNFVLHWTFALEVLLVVMALIALARRSGDLRCEASA